MSRVTVTNPFDLLTDENEDPAPKKEQKPAAPAKPAAKPAAVASKPAAAKPAAPKADAAKAPAKPAETKAAAKPPTGNSANSTVKPAAPRDANTNLQEHNKETRAPRDKRDRPPQATGDRKRTFDRKSGTGRPQNEVKKGGQGKGNWGGEVDAKEGAEALKDKEEKTDDKEETEDNEKVTVEGDKKEVDEEAAKAAAAEAAAKAAEEKEMTYEEYLAKQKAKAPPKVEALKPRVVAAEDLSAAGLVALQRDGASEEKKDKKQPAATGAAGAAGEKKDSKKKEENLAAKLLTFASHQDSRRSDRPFRGGRDYDSNRGGERRGSGNKGPRGPRPNDSRGPAPQGANSPSTQPPVQEKDFPALGGSDPVKA